MGSASESASQGNADPGEAYEQRHVHEVYQQIAHHFSSTRYKVRILPKFPMGSTLKSTFMEFILTKR